MTEHKDFLQVLKGRLETRGQTVPFWMEDLLLHGPRFEEWKGKGVPPNRMMLTEFLARWLKSLGLSEAECLEWLYPYCCEVLALTSRSGPSMIRHGTKANIRWVYNSAFLFDFEAIVRELPPEEIQGKIPYMPVYDRWWHLLVEAKQKQRDAYVPPVFLPVIPVKKRYREQFEKALALAIQKKSEGAKLPKIVDFLNEQGFLTKTGRKWTSTILHSVMRKSPWKPPETQSEAAPDTQSSGP